MKSYWLKKNSTTVILKKRIKQNENGVRMKMDAVKALSSILPAPRLGLGREVEQRRGEESNAPFWFYFGLCCVVGFPFSFSFQFSMVDQLAGCFHLDTKSQTGTNGETSVNFSISRDPIPEN